MSASRDSASFRDPSGFVFRHEGEVYRQVNESYRDEYALLMESGLHASLVESGSIIPHVEVDPTSVPTEPGCHRLLRPERCLSRLDLSNQRLPILA